MIINTAYNFMALIISRNPDSYCSSSRWRCKAIIVRYLVYSSFEIISVMKLGGIMMFYKSMFSKYFQLTFCKGLLLSFLVRGRLIIDYRLQIYMILLHYVINRFKYYIWNYLSVGLFPMT